MGPTALYILLKEAVCLNRCFSTHGTPTSIFGQLSWVAVVTSMLQHRYYTMVYIYGCSHCCDLAASYPGLLNLAFVACIANMGEGLVKLITCNDVPGRLVDVWRSGTFPEKLQASELLITNME